MHSPVLVLNTGSSSVKFAVYDGTPEMPVTLRGKVDVIGSEEARLTVRYANGVRTARPIAAHHHDAALETLLRWLDEALEGAALQAAGHRVVHGGNRFSDPVRIGQDVLDDLRALCDLAPLHQPHNLRGIEALAELRPDLPQIACFDTAFHATLPEVARVFALPRELTAAGVRRYGFHGLSYEYIAGVLPDYLGAHAERRVVVAHLGHGASLCALHRRTSVATTMSFSPLDGIPMATRSGALDPGAVLHLQQQMGMSVDEVARLLNHRSGLLGVSGISGDMRELLDNPAPQAREAIALFVYHTVGAIGSLAAALGGIDALVFTAGIGENAPTVREAICRGCAWLGIVPDPEANARHGPCITLPDAAVSAWVIPTDEESVIAGHTLRLATATR